MLRTLGAGGTVALAIGLAGCSSDGTDGGDGAGSGDHTVAPAVTVDMTDNLTFDPEDVTVSVGDAVRWENVGTVGHSVTAYADEIPADAEYFASGGFDTEADARNEYAAGDESGGDVPEGESYGHTFDVAGTYEYFCIPHEMSGMVGEVTVEE